MVTSKTFHNKQPESEDRGGLSPDETKSLGGLALFAVLKNLFIVMLHTFLVIAES